MGLAVGVVEGGGEGGGGVGRLLIDDSFIIIESLNEEYSWKQLRVKKEKNNIVISGNTANILVHSAISFLDRNFLFFEKEASVDYILSRALAMEKI